MLEVRRVRVLIPKSELGYLGVNNLIGGWGSPGKNVGRRKNFAGERDRLKFRQQAKLGRHHRHINMAITTEDAAVSIIEVFKISRLSGCLNTLQQLGILLKNV